jgi:hypothetical protein
VRTRCVDLSQHRLRHLVKIMRAAPLARHSIPVSHVNWCTEDECVGRESRPYGGIRITQSLTGFRPLLQRKGAEASRLHSFCFQLHTVHTRSDPAGPCSGTALAHLCGRCSVRVSARTLTVFTKAFRGLHQFFPVNRDYVWLMRWCIGWWRSPQREREGQTDRQKYEYMATRIDACISDGWADGSMDTHRYRHIYKQTNKHM